MKIKSIVVIVVTLAFAGALGMYITRDHKPGSHAAVVQSEPVEAQVTAANENRQSAVSTEKASSPALQPPRPTSSNSDVAAANSPSAVIFDQALRILISSGTSFHEKQAAWGQVRAAGKFDQLITDLEQRFVSQPTVPEIPAALGQAYLQKAGTIQDIREQGILGMKADQSFDAALNLDSSNWEARYWKAKAMSYWPPQLGKGNEVIEHCLELLKQQEVLPPQEHFAQTYVLLGEQYQAQGQAEYANQAWKRGLGVFPANAALTQKLGQQQ